MVQSLIFTGSPSTVTSLAHAKHKVLGQRWDWAVQMQALNLKLMSLERPLVKLPGFKPVDLKCTHLKWLEQGIFCSWHSTCHLAEACSRYLQDARGCKR